MRFLASMMAIAILPVVAALPVHAAEIDFTPLVQGTIDLIAPAIASLFLGIILYGVAVLKKKTGIDLAIMQQGDNLMLYEGIRRGIETLGDKAVDRIQPHLSITVDSVEVAAVANRMIQKSPDLLKRMGLTETALKELVAERLRARLPLTA
ncbi:hypothetical protein DYI37_03960 [Fulvimarina endophytica]|uniref:Uncharacterized protein n=1 Tax=Fulvimarina endophytica TaxID=2293836 RepID=A0A371X716_9HYPH|nr:hypothetical protein [Fulvimarina endophytica]RFC65029.1 hypothetical protein DYI37_03960 [Fulvimarina endophytica]